MPDDVRKIAKQLIQQSKKLQEEAAALREQAEELKRSIERRSDRKNLN